MSTTKIPANVERGAAFLDERVPGWEEKLNLRTLNVSSTRGCVLGQLHRKNRGDYAAYARGLETLGLSDREAARLGFDIWGMQTFYRLTSGWKAMVLKRRAEQNQEREPS